MNNPIRKFRKFFVKPKKMNATAVRNAAASTYDEETDDTKLSGAFIIVLILHIVAVVGIVAFTRIKENRKNSEPAAIPATKDKKSGAVLLADAGGTKVALSASATPSGGAAAIENNPPKTLPSTGTLVHTVKQGETLTKIATYHAVTVADLVRMNGLKGADDINVGQVLNVPDKNMLPPLPAMPDHRADLVKNNPPKSVSPALSKTAAQSAKPAQMSTTNYTIKKGDSLMKIAREQSVSYDDLVKVNKGVDPKKIQPGQSLKLPQKK